MARILIVEDEGVLAMRLRMDLLEMGHEVTGAANNFDHAMELMEKDCPDVVLMDIVLHGDTNGIEASGIIASKWPQVRIIYMTAHSDPDTIERASATPHAGFLQKPFDNIQLRRGIELAMSG